MIKADPAQRLWLYAVNVPIEEITRYGHISQFKKFINIQDEATGKLGT
ncbi:MAG: hypothetical protein ACLTXR_08890 [Clostridia bacterium]